ncbi:MAG: 23S rRNA (uracil(1939)-C(5))-methyltransferase RlmD [Vampirovibrio sp.]|nr:23S rRNA (uracil(1939)-C(5))-methyltransferase RlmD [Vampirovibrio sp.]
MPSLPQQTPTTVTLTVTTLVHGGDGLGRTEEGQVIFAPGVIPGDVIEGLPVKQQGRWLITQPNITQPSQKRVTPNCIHANTCGGCDWQHLAGEEQHHWKSAIVTDTLIRIGKLSDPPVQAMLPVQGDPFWQTRHTVTWVVDHTGEKPSLAYHAKASHDLVSFTQCPVLAPVLMETAAWLNSQSDLLKQARQIQARANREGQVLVGFQWKSENFTPPEDMAQRLNDSPILGAFYLVDGAEPQSLWGNETLTDTFLQKSFTYGMGHFVQAHPGALDVMLQWLGKQLAEIEQPATVLDLYSGIGVLGLSLLKPGQILTCVEGDSTALAFAEQNADVLGTAENTTCLHQPVEDFVSESEEMFFDLAICDPPRNGLKPAVVSWLASHINQSIIYVSCNPATLARDVKLLAESGWTLQTVQPVDFFPQTHHVEAVAILRKHS